MQLVKLSLRQEGKIIHGSPLILNSIKVYPLQFCHLSKNYKPDMTEIKKKIKMGNLTKKQINREYEICQF